MSIIRTTITFIIGLLIWGIGTGQDVHFTQFYSSPLTLNPALTGGMAGKYRISANFREQWGAISAFRTYALGYDMSILNQTIGSDIAGVGVIALKDEVEDGGMEDLRIYGTAAYHTGLGENNNSYLAAGFQGGMIQRGMSTHQNDIVFGDQWTPTGIQPTSLDHGDNGMNKQLSFDMNAGLLWYSFLNENTNVFGGLSLFHVGEPPLSVIREEGKLSRRYVLHGGADIGVSEKISVGPNVLVMQQDKVRQLNLGSSVEFSFPEANSVFSVGAWYRLEDAAIVTASFKYQTYKIGFSYDYTTSAASQALGSHLGTYEISLILNFQPSQQLDVGTHPGPKI